MELARLRADDIRAPEGKECAATWSLRWLNFRIGRDKSFVFPPKQMKNPVPRVQNGTIYIMESWNLSIDLVFFLLR